jgi:hypothetical protein
MKKFGLPTYPIMDGMRVARRDADELEWLLVHGSIQSTGGYHYLKITKISERDYRLSRCDDTAEKTVYGASTLQTLLEVEHLDISGWHWYSIQESEQA